MTYKTIQFATPLTSDGNSKMLVSKQHAVFFYTKKIFMFVVDQKKTPTPLRQELKNNSKDVLLSHFQRKC